MANPENKKSRFDDISVSHIYETLKSKKFMQDLWFDLIQGMKDKPTYKKIKEMVNKLIDKTATDFCDVPVADDERLRRKTIIAEISIMAYTVDTVISQILFRKLQNEFYSIIENIVKDLKKEELERNESEENISEPQTVDKSHDKTIRNGNDETAENTTTSSSNYEVAENTTSFPSNANSDSKQNYEKPSMRKRNNQSEETVSSSNLSSAKMSRDAIQKTNEWLKENEANMSNNRVTEESCFGKQTPLQNNKRPGRCNFNQKWLENPSYKEWLQCHDTDKQQANCFVCGKSFSIASMGEAALKSHMKAEKHKKALSICTPNTSSHISLLNLTYSSTHHKPPELPSNDSSVHHKLPELPSNDVADSDNSDAESIISIGNFSMESVSSVHTSELSSFDDAISVSSEDEEHGKVKKRLSLKDVNEIYLNKMKPMNGVEQVKRKRKRPDDDDDDEDFKIPHVSSSVDNLTSPSESSGRKNLPQRIRKPNSKYSSDSIICPMKIYSTASDTAAAIQSKSPPQAKETQSVIPPQDKEISPISPKKRGRPRKINTGDLQQSPVASDVENASGMIQTKIGTSTPTSSTPSMSNSSSKRYEASDLYKPRLIGSPFGTRGSTAVTLFSTSNTSNH